MAKIKLGKHGLKLTEGTFKLRGKVTGILKDDSYKESTQTDGKQRKTLKFGVKTSLENEIWTRISEGEKQYAYFYKKGDKKAGIEGETKKVAWEQRNNFHEDGFEPIGVTIGLDKDAEEKNITLSMNTFDSAKYIYERLDDNQDVLIMGNTDFSSFDGKEGKIRSRNLNINKIYNSFVDFEKEDFIEENAFKQTFLFMSIERANGEDGKPDTKDPRFIVKGKIVAYKTLEDVEFVIRNKKLGMSFQKNLKPYNCITCHGIMNNKRMEQVIEEVESEVDDWGSEVDPFEKNHVSNPRKFEFEIKGIDTKNIDKTTYTEKIITEAFKADEEFGEEWEGNAEIENKDEETDGYDW